MKLIDLNKHDVFKIVSFDDVCENMKERLSSMGASKNSMGQVLHKGFFGPIEVEFNGSKIAIDDFGSGYSNFAHILNLDIDYLKIDGAFIKNIVNDEKSKLITKSIVALAKESKIK